MKPNRIENFNVNLPDEIEMFFDDVEPGMVKFKYDDEMKAAVPTARELYDQLHTEAEKVIGSKLESLGPNTVWVMGVRGPGEGIGEHREGFDDSYTILIALNSIPETAGGVLKIEDDERTFPHKKGRAVIFPSQRLHGNKLVTEPVLRVTLAGLVRPVS